MKCSQGKNQMCQNYKSLDLCFAFKQEKGKLESRCKQGIFIGYDKNSPAYLVYYPETEKVQKHRLVKFSNKADREKGTQTSESHTGVDNSMSVPVGVPEVTTTDSDVDENFVNENVTDVHCGGT